MRQALIYLFIGCFIYVLASCSNLKFWGEEPLGKHFFVVNAGGIDATLIYCTSSQSPEDECDAGITVVPARVVEYKFDNKWIIAKSRSDSATTYWIIDKDFKDKLEFDNGFREKVLFPHVAGPLDSTNFYSQLELKKVNLKL